MRKGKKTNRNRAARAAFAFLLILTVLTNVFPFDLPFMSRSALAAEGDYIISGDSLHKTTIRIRPARTRSTDHAGTAVGINDNGSGTFFRQNVVHLFNLNDSSRFYLEKAGSDCFTMRFFNGSGHKRPYYKIIDIESDNKYKKEGAVLHAVESSDHTPTNRHWRFIRHADGTYYIQNVRSGLYWTLEGGSLEDETRIVQTSNPTAWEIEIVDDENESAITRLKRQYDSYTYYMNNTFGSGSDTGIITSADWMTHLPDNMSLADISIPGVHDAGAARTDFNNKAQCQQLNIHDMLYNGVRYFDCRLSYTGTQGGIFFIHGMSKCYDDTSPLSWSMVKGWINNFLKAYPGETVFLQIKSDNVENAMQRTEEKVLEDLRSWEKVYWWNSSNPEMPTLGDVRGKVVIISRFSKVSNVTDIALDARDWQLKNDAYSHAKVTGGTYLEVWDQDDYSMNGTDKMIRVNACLFNENTNARYRRKEVASRGKKAFIVTYTSCTNKTPQDAARHSVHNQMKGKLYDWDGSYDTAFLGIVCNDFIDEELSWLIYRRNFFKNRIIFKGMGFNGETPFPDYEIQFKGDDISPARLQSLIEPKVSDIYTSFNRTIDGKTWHPYLGSVKMLGVSPERIMTGNEVRTYTINYSQITFHDNCAVIYVPLDYTGRQVTVTYNKSGVSTQTFPGPQTVDVGHRFTKPADPTANGKVFQKWERNRTIGNDMADWVEFDFGEYYLRDVTAYARWDQGGYRITVVQAPHGTVASDKTIAQRYEQVTLTATPDPKYKLKGWRVVDSSGRSISLPVMETQTLSMPASDLTVTAEFILKNFYIYKEKHGNGSLYIDGNKTIADVDETIWLTTVPQTGYRLGILQVIERGSGAQVTVKQWGEPEEGRFSFTMPEADVTVKATFVQSNLLNVDFGVEHSAYVRSIFNGKGSYMVTGSVVSYPIPDTVSPQQAYNAFIQSIYNDLGISSLPDDDRNGGKLVKTFGNSGDFALHPRSSYDSLADLEQERRTAGWTKARTGEVTLYALWEMPVTPALVSAVSPDCGTVVTYVQHNDTYQSNPVPNLTLTSSMSFVDSGKNCTTWRGSTGFTMKGGNEYNAVFHPEPAWGYYIPDGQAPGAKITASGDNIRIISTDDGHGNVEVAVKVEHEWGPWVVVSEPGGGADGVKRRTCSTGGCVEREFIPYTHTHQTSFVPRQEPDCETPGVKAHYACDGGSNPCYGVFEDEAATRPISDLTIPPTGHDWEDWVVTEESTCTTMGLKIRTCRNNADHTQTQSLPIDPDAHDWGEWTVVRQATERQDGLEQRVCSRCTQTQERTFPWNHSHRFIYTAGEGALRNTVTAVCEAKGNSCCSYQNPGITITLNAPTDTLYDGTPKEATLSGYPGTPVENLAPKPSISYVKLTYDGKETPVETPLSSAPSASGWYAAKVIWGGVMAAVSFDIIEPDGEIYTVKVTTEGEGTATASRSKGLEGMGVILTAVPAEGWQFVEWVVVAGGVIIENNMFNIGTANVEVKAVFEKIPHTVTITTEGQGTASALPASGTEGTLVTLTAVPDEGWEFAEWKVVSGGVTITDNAFTIGTENVEISAVFREKPAPVPFEYFCYSGANQDHVKKSGRDAVFVIKRSIDDQVTYSRFLKIRTDGTDVAAANYTTEEGSIVITLKAAWLDTLPVGAHTLGVIFSDGAAEIPFSVSQEDPAPPTVVPHTGDGTSPPMWLGIVLLGLLGIGILTVSGKKN